jgi:hypothetical protein
MLLKLAGVLLVAALRTVVQQFTLHVRFGVRDEVLNLMSRRITKLSSKFLTQKGELR